MWQTSKCCSRSIRSPGSAAVNMCLVACGAADAYYHMGIHCWDMAGGAAIIREAGGVIMDISGDSLCTAAMLPTVHSCNQDVAGFWRSGVDCRCYMITASKSWVNSFIDLIIYIFTILKFSMRLKWVLGTCYNMDLFYCCPTQEAHLTWCPGGWSLPAAEPSQSASPRW